MSSRRGERGGVVGGDDEQGRLRLFARSRVDVMPGHHSHGLSRAAVSPPLLPN